MTGAERRRRRRTGRIVATAATVVVVAVAATAAAGFGFGSGSGDDPSAAASTLPPATAKVTRQTLADVQTKSGTLGHGDSATLTGRVAGTVTALPATGATVRRGQPIYKVDNTPVVLLYGTLPAYRALAPDTEGADVKLFEQNLYALGYRGFTVDETYTDATATAVKEWQDDLGLPKTGTVDLGRIVYAPGAVRVDTRKVAVGDSVGPNTALLTYTGVGRAVTVELDASDEALARKGAGVTITLPTGGTVRGTIAAVQTVIDTSSDNGNGSSDPTTKIDVTITIHDVRPLAGIDNATVDVAFTASERPNVLTVPVAALLALAEGGYGVQVVQGTTSRIVAVQTGQFAGGRVEVSGDGIAEGTTVGVPS